jgi:hypothetical protein
VYSTPSTVYLTPSLYGTPVYLTPSVVYNPLYRETIGTLQKAQQQIEASDIVIENLRLEQTESMATLKVLKQSERTAKTDLKVCVYRVGRRRCYSTIYTMS